MTARPVPLRAAPAAVLLALVSSAACRSPAEHRASADREVYAIVEERRAQFLGEARPFRLESPAERVRDRVLSGELAEIGPLDLVDCLRIAAENSREYERRKEGLYLVALDLTLERYRFQLQKVGTLAAFVDGAGSDAQFGQAQANLGFARVLGTGAAIIGDIGLRVFRDLSSADAWSAVTDVGLTVTQPLLRGFGRRIVLEPLTQAERDVVYEVRAFERFRRSFAVDVANRFYGLLQQADQVANEEQNFANLEVLRERNEALAEAGRLSDIQVDQARQDELRSKNRLIQQRQRFQALLDEFRLFLGLPIETRLTLDPMALEELEETRPLELAEMEGDLIRLALAARLDYLTSLDRVDDRERKVTVAADALRAGLSVTAAADWSSEVDQPLNFRTDNLDWTLAVDVDLPIDRLVERNAYRASLIALDAARREAVELADEIQVALRDALRELEATEETYLIQLNAVELAERRVESTRLNLEAGRASTRDILEAQEALLEARNAVTAALIDYHLAELALYRDLEVLRADEQGISVDPALLGVLKP